MDISPLIAFITALAGTFVYEFTKSLGINTGAHVSNTIARSAAKARRKTKSCFSRVFWILVLTGIIWLAIKFYPLLFALI